MADGSQFSAGTAALIDEEVKRITAESETEAKRILSEHRDQLEIIAQALLKYETLSGAEIDALLRGEELQREGAVDDMAAARRLFRGSLIRGLPSLRASHGAKGY